MEKNAEYNSLGEFLKAYRVSHAMTQEQFASQIGINRTRYVLAETGKSRPGIRTVGLIAKATKKSPAYINALIEKKKED